MYRGAWCFVALVLVAACSGATRPADVPQYAGQIVPLTVGTHWTYDVLDTIVTGIRPGGASGVSPPASIRVVADTTDGVGNRWSVVEGGGDILGNHVDYTPQERHVWRNFSDGAFMLEMGAVRLRFYSYPTALGVTNNGGATVASLDTVLTVPAGRFHCLRYDFPNGGRAFASPGIGVVERWSQFGIGLEGGQVMYRAQGIYRLRSFVIGP